MCNVRMGTCYVRIVFFGTDVAVWFDTDVAGWFVNVHV